MANRWGNNGNSERLLFSWVPKSLQMVAVAMKLKIQLLLGRNAVTNLDNVLKSITLLSKVCIVRAIGFSNGHVRMWESDNKDGRVPKNWSPVDCKEIEPVNTKGNQSLIFIGRTDAKAVAPVLWPCNLKSRFIGMNQPWIYMYSPSRSPLPPPSPPDPSGSPSAPGLSTCLMHPTWAGDLFHPR